MKNKTKEKQLGTIIGVDLGDTKHAICVTDKKGNILAEFTIINHAKEIERLAEAYPRARVALEVGTHSPWISRLLTAKGLDVVVANARKLRAIYANERKCDKLDARMLAKLLRVDIDLLHPVRHGSEASQLELLHIKLRDSLVRQRVTAISTVRGTLKSLGVRLSSPSSPAFTKQARHQLAGPAGQPALLEIIEPMLKAIDEHSAQIKHYDKSIAKAAEGHPECFRFQQIAGVGPITALTFALVVEDPLRFEDPRDVGTWLGLVPRRDQSGASDKQLPISKAGNQYLRCLLVQSAQYLLGHWGADCDLRRHGLKLASRGGKAAKKKAVIAIARKLAVLMLAMWKRQSDYEPLKRSGGDELGDQATAMAA
jgi:transposase